MRSKHIDALDGVRGLAILLVMSYHLGGGAQSSNFLLHLVGETSRQGWSGVPLFFVLSGFLITGILWETKDDNHFFRNFYGRRFLRIFPLYYGALVLTWLCALPLGKLKVVSRQIWIYLLYLQNIPGLQKQVMYLPSLLTIGHFWSLAVEEQFYLIWPLAIKLIPLSSE